MESRAKLFGHPIHQMLVVFPLGLLATAVIFDIIHAFSGNAMWATMSFYLIAAGILGGLLAAVFGLRDYLAIPIATRARSVGARHGMGNVVVLALFAASWFLRREDPSAPGTLALTLSSIGAILSLVTAWLGGELVDRLGVGVYDGAHLNAPSSLNDRSGSPTGPGPAPRHPLRRAD